MAQSDGARHTSSAATNSSVPRGHWKPWGKGWLGVLVLAFINGGLHRTYEPALGVLRAEQVSNVLLVSVVVPWAVLVDRRYPTCSTREALAVGGLWGTMTVAFEFIGGHYINGDAWTTLFRGYNLSAGHLWPMAVAGVTVSPTLARRFRLRRH